MSTRNKKRISLLLTVILLLSLLCSCGKQGEKGKSLREHGMDIVNLMDEMIKSDAYSSLLIDSNNNSLYEIQEQLVGDDYTSVDKVYKVSIPSIQELLSYIGESDTIDGLSDSLKTYLNTRSASTLISQLNSLNGAAVLAVSSIYTAGKTFVNSELNANTVYLYTFRDGYPIAVSFVVGEDGAVSASGMFILNEAFRGTSVEQLSEVLRQFEPSCTIELLED